MIVALIYGRKEISNSRVFWDTFFISINAGKTIFFFLHLLPIVNNLRNPEGYLGHCSLLLPLPFTGQSFFMTRTKMARDSALSGGEQRGWWRSDYRAVSIW